MSRGQTMAVAGLALGGVILIAIALKSSGPDPSPTPAPGVAVQSDVQAPSDPLGLPTLAVEGGGTAAKHETQGPPPTPEDPVAAEVSPSQFHPDSGELTRLILHTKNPKHIRIAIHTQTDPQVLIKILYDNTAPGAETAWDGTDSTGKKVPPGAYFATFETKGRKEQYGVFVVR